MILARRSAGVLSMKLTVRRRGVGPQYFDTITDILSGSMIASAPTAASGPNTGAFIGLIFTAVFAAFINSRRGRFFGAQTSSLCSCGCSSVKCPPSTAEPATRAIVERASRRRSSISVIVVTSYQGSSRLPGLEAQGVTRQLAVVSETELLDFEKVGGHGTAALQRQVCWSIFLNTGTSALS